MSTNTVLIIEDERAIAQIIDFNLRQSGFEVKAAYDGVTGHIVFDEIGDAKRDTAFIKACNTKTGEWEFVAEQGVK